MIVSAGASVHVDFECGSCTQQVICTKVNMTRIFFAGWERLSVF